MGDRMNLRAMKTAKGWKKWWWDKTNPKCLGCSMACKQSDKVTLVYCPQFDKGEAQWNSGKKD